VKNPNNIQKTATAHLDTRIHTLVILVTPV
jgi:hypothetical protein